MIACISYTCYSNSEHSRELWLSCLLGHASPLYRITPGQNRKDAPRLKLQGLARSRESSLNKCGYQHHMHNLTLNSEIKKHRWGGRLSHQILPLLNLLLRLFNEHFLLLFFLLDDGPRHDGSALALLPFGRALCLLFQCLLLLLFLVLFLLVLSLLSYAPLLLLLHYAWALLLAQLQC